MYRLGNTGKGNTQNTGLQVAISAASDGRNLHGGAKQNDADSEAKKYDADSEAKKYNFMMFPYIVF